jgi:rhamnose transport system permease protein
MLKFRSLLLSWEALLVILLLLCIGLGNMLSPYFLSGYNFASLSSQMMEKGIMVLPMTLIVIVGEIDLSVASVLGLSSVVLGMLWSTGHPIWFAICGTLLIALVAGLVNGLLVTRLGLPSLVVTLGALALYRGLGYVIMGDQAVSNFPAEFTNLGFSSIPGTIIPWSVAIFSLLALVFIVVLHLSRLGRQLYAMGNSKEAARFAGIPVSRIKLGLFMLSSVMAALAGIIFTARFSSSRPDNAVGFELDVVTVVLLGGINIFGGQGTLLGAILALFIVAVLRNALSLADISGDIQNVAIGLLLIFSVLGPNIVRRIQAALARRRLAAGSS